MKEELCVPVMALTATATPRVREDIARSLGLEDPLSIVLPFTRPNLRFSVELGGEEKTRVARTVELLLERGFGAKAPAGRAIVYTVTKKRAEHVQRALRKAGIRAGYYHAGRRDSARERAQLAFEARKTPVLVATSAYGMGIDLPDVRVVIHAEAPGTLEGYAQQAGRAGRDGDPAECLLLFSPADARVHELLRRGSTREASELGFRALEAYAWSSACRQRTIAQHFGDAGAKGCAGCDACLEPTAVAARITKARALLQKKRAKIREESSHASSVQLDEQGLATLVAFVDGLVKPVGRRLVVKGLRGSRARDVVRKKLVHNAQFGALKGMPEEAIFHAIDRLLASGLLVPKGKKYPTLWVAGKGVRPRAAERRKKAPLDPLTSALQRFRRAEAKRRRIKPYQVFQNRALDALREARPSTREELAAVWGMGEARIEKYGDALLELLRGSD